MHPLHDYVAKQLADKLKDRGVVVWYDERSEFQPFVDEVREGPRAEDVPIAVGIAGAKARLVEYSGSIFQLRAAVEPLVSGDRPESLVIYLPGVRHDSDGSVLMELEKAGRAWKPDLKHLARNVLLQKFTLGIVDELLPSDRKVTYEDMAIAAADDEGAEAPSMLRVIFSDARGSDDILVLWMLNDGRDADVESKAATGELIKLIKARLALELNETDPIAKLRAITSRYVLANEFRLDLACGAPASLEGIPAPSGKSEEVSIRDCARRLRMGNAQAYAALADRIEAELGLRDARLAGSDLGSIDTFRFEEQALLADAGARIVAGEYEPVMQMVAEREHSFWLIQDVSRRAQWEAVRRMAELGRVADEVNAAVMRATGDARVWFESYVRQDGSGWFRLDHAQRRLESWVANLDDEPSERPLATVRRAYEYVVQAMALGFANALAASGWAVTDALAQTRVFSDVVAGRPRPMAFFMVDAMRFEMGAELAERLPKTSEVTLRAGLGSLPSITPIGMAALLPGASASFSVVEEGKKLGASIEGTFLADLQARRKFSSARIPGLVDLSLDELLSLQGSKLAKKLEGAEVLFVRSQEIDAAGEAGLTIQARRAMDPVLDNLARAIRKLAAKGIEHVVIAADHGHLFFPTERDESLRINAPGGDTLELHRRCWIGRGGSTPPGCVRVTAAALGYPSDLEFVFPSGASVFRAGGDLAYYHGGASLQELVIPVLSVVTTAVTGTPSRTDPVAVTGAPDRITNRIFTAQLAVGGAQLILGASTLKVQGVLIANGKQVGSVAMAVNAPFDNETGMVELDPNVTTTVAFLLADAAVEAVRIVILEPATDAELYRSPQDIPVNLTI